MWRRYVMISNKILNFDGRISLNFEIFNFITALLDAMIRCTRFAPIDSPRNEKADICVKNFNVKKFPWETIRNENGQRRWWTIILKYKMYNYNTWNITVSPDDHEVSHHRYVYFFLILRILSAASLYSSTNIIRQ